MNLWGKESSIAYVDGRWLRESPNLEENASFLVRWASELYADWATWMK